MLQALSLFTHTMLNVSANVATQPRLVSCSRSSHSPFQSTKRASGSKNCRLVVRAEKSTDEKAAEIKKQFADTGLDKATAQRVLKQWESESATDAESLKKLLRRRSLKTAGRIVIQTVLDAGAAFGAYNFSTFLRLQEDLPLNWLWSGAASFLGTYFAVGVLFDLFSIGALGISSLRFQTDSAAFLTAVKELAGDASGLNVVDKAQQARNTLKVLKALNNISSLLQEEGIKSGSSSSTLSGLSSYLLLSQAEEKYGWNYEKEGLSYDEAGIIAKLFSKFDTNDDGKLDMTEVKALTRELAPDLSEEESNEAFRVLDTDNSRFIEFPEFAKLYQNKIQKPPTEGTNGS